MQDSEVNLTLTNIVELKLFNPATYAEIQLSSLSAPVTIRLPLDYKNTTDFVRGSTRFEVKDRQTGSIVFQEN